ncbi:MAG: carboxypeptidase-like regulatory domain-containing protein [Xanthobacteraceae bacterium]
MRTAIRLAFAAAGIAALLCGFPTDGAAQPAAVSIGDSDLGGVVAGDNGPEAGVWVIAETTDLPTKFVKIVVTDDRGRYLLPELPKANYSVWVRGYGLVDSPKVTAAPGKVLNLTAVVAPNEKVAADYYPAQWWYSMLRIPDKSLFPGTGAKGNGMSERMRSQQQWLASIKSQGCGSCHQLGNKPTRLMNPRLPKVDDPIAAWVNRLQVGPAAEIMIRNVNALDPQHALQNFADWTSRIAAGELPKSRPPRPAGVERNIVITLWDWGTPKDYVHDEVATDRRNPTVNANGKIYGATEDSTDLVPVLDPVTHTASQVRLATRVPVKPRNMFIAQQADYPMLPSPFWGEEKLWGSHTTPHNPMFDHKGRVWFTSRIREAATPAFCRKGSDHPSAKLFPIERAGRQLSFYDPKTEKLTLIDTCFTTHHLNFAEDENHTLWLSAGGARAGYVGWLNTKLFDETGDEQKAQNWSPIILDTNGNGRRDEGYVGPNDPVDPAKDKRIVAALYAIAYNPVDKTIWGTMQAFPGGIVRIIPGDNPPATVLAEFYEPPFPGYGPRGGDIDRNGVYWVSLASGHLGSFDRRKCKGPLNGPKATGRHCPEGWTLYPFPGPQFETVTDAGSAQASYYSWVDQHDTLGLGRNVPIATGNFSDSLEALVDGKWVTLRVPYPMGFHAKGLDGRIDDPNAGWKGRAVWSAYAGRATWHIEGEKERPKVVKFQLRPDPLVR